MKKVIAELPTKAKIEKSHITGKEGVKKAGSVGPRDPRMSSAVLEGKEMQHSGHNANRAACLTITAYDKVE